MCMTRELFLHVDKEFHHYDWPQLLLKRRKQNNLNTYLCDHQILPLFRSVNGLRTAGCTSLHQLIMAFGGAAVMCLQLLYLITTTAIPMSITTAFLVMPKKTWTT